MKRALVYLSALAGVGGLLAPIEPTQAQAPTPGAAPAPAAAAAPRPASGKVAVFNVARVMKDYQRWQYYAAIMNKKRTEAAATLGKLRNDMAQMQEQVQNPATPKAKQEEIAKQMVDKKRQFEDQELNVRKALDEESSGHLKTLFGEIQLAVKAIVEANNFDVVFAYPDAISEEEKSSPLYFDLKMRPQAAMPFFVSPSADMTEVLVATLNKNFPPPGPIPATPGTPPPAGAPAGGVQPTGATAPAPAAKP